MRRIALAAGVPLGLLLLAPTAALAADGPTLDETVSAVNTTWVIVAGVLVMFMQAGFLFLEVGFSRAKNAGLGVVKILTNFSICAIAYWAVGFALAFGGAGTIAGTHGWFLDVGHTASEAAARLPAAGRRRHQPGGAAVLPVRLLRGLAGDRLGHDARADQVQRLRDLRGDLLRGDLPGAQPLDLRRRLAPGERRHAGLRRLDRGAPDRRHRRLRGAAAARPAPGQVRPRRQAAGDPGALDAARRPRACSSSGWAGSASTRARRSARSATASPRSSS